MTRNLLRDVYIALLNHPHDAWRALNQPVYCVLRDEIAMERGWTSEKTQTHFELIASQIKESEAKAS